MIPFARDAKSIAGLAKADEIIRFVNFFDNRPDALIDGQFFRGPFPGLYFGGNGSSIFDQFVPGLAEGFRRSLRQWFLPGNESSQQGGVLHILFESDEKTGYRMAILGPYLDPSKKHWIPRQASS